MAETLFFFFGFGVMWLGFQTAEDVHQIAFLVTGIICLVWGFAVASLPIQLLVTLSLTMVLGLVR